MASGWDAVTYSASTARVRGLYSRLLDASTWDELLRADTLASALYILRGTGYGPALQRLEQGEAPRLDLLEGLLVAHAAENDRRAMRLTRGSVRALLFVWWRQYELENLKTVFRGVDQGLAPQQIERLLVPLGEHPTLPWESLVQEVSVPGLVERMRGTHYINPLRNAFPAYQRLRSLFPLEIALDIRYYRDITAAIHDLGGADRDDARHILGTWLDMLDILWAYRHRVYYHMSAEEIVNYTMWHTERTDTRLIRAIALGAEPREVVDQVFGPGRVDLTALEGLRGEAVMPALELALKGYWRELARREMGGYPFKMGTILGYLVLQEIEARDLVTVLEAKRMLWPPERIREYLVRRTE